MRKFFKRGLALGVALTMVMGNSVVAWAADDSSTITGNGTYAGDIIEADINVMLPVQPVDGSFFDYAMDPERVLDITGFFDGDDVEQRGGDTGVYFFWDEDDTHVVSSTSQAYTAVNKSRVPIDLTVEVGVADGTFAFDLDTDKISGVTKADFEAAADPSIYLGIQIGEVDAAGNDYLDVFAADENDRTITGRLDGVPDNFEVKGIETDAAIPEFQWTEIEGSGNWQAVDVFVEGAITVFDLEGDSATPAVEVTWSFDEADPNEVVAGFTNAHAVNIPPVVIEPTLINGEDVFVASEYVTAQEPLAVEFDYGSYDAISAIKYSEDGINWFVDNGTMYTINAGNGTAEIVFASSYVNAIVSNNLDRMWSVTFVDEDGEPVTIAFTIMAYAD